MENEEEKKLFTVVAREYLNHNVLLIKMKCKEEIKDFKVCSFVFIYDKEGNKKPYTPIYCDKDTYAFVVKVYSDGTLSQYISHLQLDDTVLISNCNYKRLIKLNEFKNTLFIVGGTGVTPAYQMINHLILTDMNITDFTMIFLNKTPDDIFLEKQLEALKKKSNGKLHIVHVIGSGLEESNKHFISGRLDKNMLLKITNGKMFDFVYICGPPQLYETFSGPKTVDKQQGELTGILKEIGYTEQNVFKL